MRLERQAGGRFHPKLNRSSRPLANKYHEGKVKRTLERGLKVSELAEEEANGTCSDGKLLAYLGRMESVVAQALLDSLPWSTKCCLPEHLLLSSRRQTYRITIALPWRCECSGLNLRGDWRRALRVCVNLSSRMSLTQRKSCEVLLRPVLKHGPRSLTCALARTQKPCLRNESDC